MGPWAMCDTLDINTWHSETEALVLTAVIVTRGLPFVVRKKGFMAHVCNARDAVI